LTGLDASDNETRTLKKFEHDTWYKIHLKVSEEKIEAWIDDEQIVDFSYEGRQLSIRPEVESFQTLWNLFVGNHCSNSQYSAKK
jgi:hypothetical protein